MKPHLDIRHEGTLGDQGRTRMSFDEASSAHLMGILTDLYSDRETAVIREYSTNAWDSHQAAGRSDPIQIVLPSALDPTFIVKDSGVGMSVDDVVLRFSKYGWSSKRETDGEVGLLGLGCKSGLTYTSQFTLIAVQEGVKAVVLVTRDSDGAGSVQVIDTVGTGEPNGVEVRVPVRDVGGFRKKAANFFRFWREGAVLVDGEEPVRIGGAPGDVWVDPDVLLTAEAHDTVVMGGTPYSIRHNGDQGAIVPGRGVVAWVPIGSVDFAPSREELRDTRRTRAAIADLREFVETSIVRKAQADISAEKERWKALDTARQWSAVLTDGQMSTLRYDGSELPFRGWKVQATAWTGYNELLPSTKIKHLSTAWATSSAMLFITGWTQPCLTKVQKAKINLYRDRAGRRDLSHVVLSAEAIAPEWLGDLPHANWKDIHSLSVAVEKAQKRPAGMDQHGRFTALGSDGYFRQRRIDPGTDLLYVRAADKVKPSNLADAMAHIAPKTPVVRITKLQEGRFLAENPSAVYMATFLDAVAYVVLGRLTATHVHAINYGRRPYHRLSSVVHRILDPELRELVATIPAGSTRAGDSVRDWECLRKAYRAMDLSSPGLPSLSTIDRSRIEGVELRYPLLDSHYYGSRADSHYLDYVNAMYAQLTSKNGAV